MLALEPRVVDALFAAFESRFPSVSRWRIGWGVTGARSRIVTCSRRSCSGW